MRVSGDRAAATSSASSSLAPLLPPGTPVWVHCDSAYYRGEFVEYLREHGWTDIGMGESATWVRYRPAKWKDEQSYVVVRRAVERQGELLPRFTVLLANRDDLPLAEVVRRHRSKQVARPAGRFENAFKAPLVDSDLHHPPCGGYRANQAFYAYGRMACCRRPRGGTASGR